MKLFCLQVLWWLIRANKKKIYYVVRLHIPVHAEVKLSVVFPNTSRESQHKKVHNFCGVSSLYYSKSAHRESKSTLSISVIAVFWVGNIKSKMFLFFFDKTSKRLRGTTAIYGKYLIKDEHNRAAYASWLILQGLVSLSKFWDWRPNPSFRTNLMCLPVNKAPTAPSPSQTN